MQLGLANIFPEADPSCSKDISRMYFGGKGLLYFDESIPRINIESLFRNMSLYLRDKHGATNYKRNIIGFSKRTGIGLNKNNLLDISVGEDFAEAVGKNQDNNINGKNLPKSYIIIYRFGKFFPNRYYKINFNNNPTSCLSN